MKKILTKTNTEKGIRNVYLIAFILLFLAYLVNLYANRQLVKQASAVEHTNDVIRDLDNMLSKVKDGETGVRGYVITKKAEFLFPYFGSYEATDSLYKDLLQLTVDNPSQHERLNQLKAALERRFEILRFSIKSFNTNNREMTDSMTQLQTESRQVMDDIRNKISTIAREENRLLIEREHRLKRTTQAITTITIVSLTLAFSLIFFGFITYMRVSKERQKGQQAIMDYQDQLKNRIADLDKANTELIKMRSLEKFAATGRIARTIAHEVRNPLTNINLAVDQLKTEVVVQQDETSTMLFDMIKRNSTRINQLISDLLNSTKFSELTYEKVSVNALLDETLKEAEDRIALTNVKVIKKYSTDVCDVAVDKGKIKIAFLNIIINAIEAMEHKEGSVLTLETKGENDKCKVLIKDNGAGLDSESANRLFEPYFTSKPKGNGLGLTNTQNIILNHKGEISVETTKGKGTCFTITLNFPS
jgi:signal transduction histidine kinase